MKKIVLFIATFSVVLHANKYSFLKTKDAELNQLVAEEYSLGISDEYQSYHSDNTTQIDIMSEYEQHVVDAIKPPVVSRPTAFLTHLGCAALIQYIALQEKAKMCFVECKQVLNKWFNFITTLY